MCTRPLDYSSKKYHLLKILHNMSVQRYRNAMSRIPEVMFISRRTLEKWMYLDKDDTYQIPYSQLVQLSSLLEVNVADLINHEIKDLPPLKTMLNDQQA